MSKVEVTQEEYQYALEQDKLLGELLNHPEFGTAAKRAIKQLRPSVEFPELNIISSIEAKTKEVEDKTETRLKEIDDKLSSFLTNQQENAKKSEVQADLESVVKKFGLTEEGRQKILQRAQDKKHLDFEAHAQAIIAAEPKAIAEKSTNYFPEQMNLHGTRDHYHGNKMADDVTRLTQDPEGWANEVVNDMMNNPENYPEMTSH